jgi:hypothetical protein
MHGVGVAQTGQPIPSPECGEQFARSRQKSPRPHAKCVKKVQGENGDIPGSDKALGELLRGEVAVSKARTTGHAIHCCRISDSDRGARNRGLRSREPENSTRTPPRSKRSSSGCRCVKRRARRNAGACTGRADSFLLTAPGLTRSSQTEHIAQSCGERLIALGARASQCFLSVRRDVEIWGQYLELLGGHVVDPSSLTVIEVPLVLDWRLENLAAEPVMKTRALTLH